MNRKYNKWFFRGLLGFLTVFGISSCTDDHYDVGTMSDAKGSLWENIVETHKCDSFAMILQKTIVKKKDYGTPATLTYEQLLKSSRVMTVWAPTDGTYNASKWLEMLEAGQNEEVELQFVANHMAYFNYSGSYPQNQKILLANTKYANYDNTVTPNTFHNVPISTTYCSVPATNGTLHVLDASSEFVPNLREFLPLHPELSKLNDFILSQDTVEFRPNSSTVGTTVNGVVHYVDSVFYEYNQIYPSYSETEDSCFAAIFPSNSAWDEAFTKIANSYKYLDGYPYMANANSVTLSIDSVKADSLREIHAVKAIINNMFYSLDEQPAFDVKDASVETVSNFFRTCDSLVSKPYYRYSYRYHQHAPECRDLAEGKDAVEASNGYAFITDHFNFKANNSWQFDVELEAEQSMYLNKNASIGYANVGSYETLVVTDATRNPYVEGVISNKKYMRFNPSGAAAKITLSYNVPNILSGKYDIYVVMVPENMLDSLNTKPKFTPFIASIVPYYKATSATKITEQGAKTNGTTSAYLKNDPTKVDTILLFENFEFPYSYAGVPNARPVIKLTSAFKTSLTKTATPYFSIDKFIFKSKDE